MKRSRVCFALTLLGYGDASPDAKPTPSVEQAPAVERSKPSEPLVAETPPTTQPSADDEFDPALGSAFALAAADLAQHPATPPATGPRWKPPECELEYQFRLQIGQDPSGDMNTAMLIDGSWTARAGGPGMLLQNGELHLVQRMGSTRRPAQSVQAGSLAEIRLQTDGRSWTEVDGPAALWSAYGTWSGLAKFYPTLPEQPAPGSAAQWLLETYERSAAGKVEGERGTLEIPEGVKLPEPAPTKLEAKLTLERWLEFGGSRAAIVRARYEHHEGDGSPGTVTIDELGQGQYVIHESGVLLFAELREHAEIRFGAGETAQTQDMVLLGEARLVRGCGQPVLSELGGELPANSPDGDRK